MKLHEFVIVASGPDLADDDWDDRLYREGCDDAVVSLQRGLLILHFDREAGTFSEAVESGIADVRRAGLNVLRVEPDPFVSASDIAELVGTTRQAVSHYVNGTRGENFPAPVLCMSGSRPLWRWSKVAAWLHAQGKLGADDVDNALLIERLNDGLSAHHSPSVVRNAPIANNVEMNASPREASKYATMEYYTRKEIPSPRFRTAADAGDACRRSSGFRLRPHAGRIIPRQAAR